MGVPKEFESKETNQFLRIRREIHEKVCIIFHNKNFVITFLIDVIIGTFRSLSKLRS